MSETPEPATGAEAYDAFPYEGTVSWFSYPDHLAVLGRIAGLSPAPVETMRVLELGCSDGANLRPMAQTWPQARFVGLDLSQVELDAAAAANAALGIDSIELLRADVATVSASALGEFDYIIAHGLFSWVPDHARDAILALCSDCLAPHGLAMISYNALPGWHTAAAMSRLLRFHTGPVKDDREKVLQARQMAAWFADRMGQADPEIKGRWWAMESALIGKVGDQLIRHDYLADHSEPFYFEDVYRRAEDHALAYVADAMPSQSWIGSFPTDVREMLETVWVEVRREQYMDFFHMTRFRRTVLCRADAPKRDEIDLSVLLDMHVTSWLEPAQLGALDRGETLTVETRRGELQLEGAPNRVLLQLLSARAPRAWPVRELSEAVIAGLAERQVDSGLAATAEGRDQLRAAFVRHLYQLFRDHVVMLHVTPPPLAAAIGERPLTGAVQRDQAARGFKVTSFGHHNWGLDDDGRAILQRLDGTTDRAALRAEFGDSVDTALEKMWQHGLLRAPETA